jgi:hypothetical protein
MKYFNFLKILFAGTIIFFSCSTEEKNKTSPVTADDTIPVPSDYERRIGPAGLDKVKETKEYRIDTISKKEFDLFSKKYQNPCKAYPEKKKKDNYFYYSLTNGKSMVFQDYQSEHTEDSRTYYCQCHTKTADFIRAEYWDGRDMYLEGFLIDKKTGNIDTIYTYPVLSPDLNYLISIDYDYANPSREEKGPSAIHLLKRVGDIYVAYKYWAFNDYIIDDLVWIDNKSIALEIFPTTDVEFPITSYIYLKMDFGFGD